LENTGQKSEIKRLNGNPESLLAIILPGICIRATSLASGQTLGVPHAEHQVVLQALVRQLSQLDLELFAKLGSCCVDLLWFALEDPAQTGVLYVDGHTRVYHGKQTKLPRHHVARQRLCMRATTDYWVNGFNGLPFFKLNCAVDPGMIKVLENEIVPTLEEIVPNQPTEDELKKDQLLSRFRIVFDREGYSPGLFRRMNKKRIACQTYRKFVTDRWPEDEFSSHRIKLMMGGEADMKLAERGVLIGSKPSDKIWVVEIRKLTPDGRQISIVSTEWKATPTHS